MRQAIRVCAGWSRAGVSAGSVQTALADDSWRAVAEANQEELLAAGLWGVPCLRVGEGPMVWGQDRLWVIEDALRACLRQAAG